MVYTPYPTRPESIFDLGHIGELSTNRTIPLLLSPQVLYALQNVAQAEIADLNRYAVSLADGGYYRLQERDTDEYAAFLEIVSQTGYQLSDYLLMGTPLNYKEALLKIASTTNAAAGLNTLQIQGPGVDEAWLIKSIALADSNSTPSLILTVITNGTIYAWIDQVASPPGGMWHIINGEWALSNGEALQGLFYGCVAGDDLSMVISGYVMELVP